jgi:hypothetical protein
MVLFGAAAVIAALCYTGKVLARPAVGFTTTTVVSGTLGDVDLLSKPIIPDSSENDRRAKAWLSLQKTSEPSNLYVQSNVWQPGGSTGWHIHPGHSLIIVTVGTVTEYEGHDPECKPHVYTQNMVFDDPHDGHAHMIRNEGTAVARTIAVQLIPVGVERRIDVAAPGNCYF